MQDIEVKFVDIVKNIFRRKLYVLVIIALISFITISHFVLHKYVFEKFVDVMMENVVNEATKVGKHISVHQDINKHNEILDIALNHIMEDFTINKIKLFDKDGYIIFSTKQKDIGTKNSHDYFYNNVQKGEIYYKVVNAGETTLEGVIIQKDVAEIYVPIVKNGKFIGASEIYYDISEKKYVLNQIIERTDTLFLILAFGLALVVFVMIYMASKSNILKRREEKRAKELDAILQKQKRTTALGELMENIAHHWRQPLNVITTLITRYKLRHDLNISSEEELAKTTDLIVKSANNLSETINRFRDYVVNAAEQKNFYINEVIDKEIKNLEESSQESNIAIKKDLDIVQINGYEKEFAEVISNLLLNSYEALQRNNIINGEIGLTLKENDNNIKVIVKDNGGGISEEIIGKIFDPYFTTKHQFQGTGLGLFFCSKIIKDYFNGTIDCHNQDEVNGAVFTIILPKP